MMCGTVPLLLMALSTTLAAPSPSAQDNSQLVVPQKRAALVLDRLLIALQKALHEDARDDLSREGPRTAPLRIDMDDVGDMRDHYQVEPLGFESAERALEPPSAPEPARLLQDDFDTSGLQRRGQAGAGRGRVLRCYFNAVTCF